MTRWEYLLIEVLDGVPMDFPQGLPGNVSDRELEEYSTTQGYFRRLGLDGWELVCSGGEENTIYTFKRPCEARAPARGRRQPSAK
jgi:hypothetical protein